MCDGNARIGWYSYCGGHPWNDFERKSRSRDGFGLFSATSKNERITAFQSHDCLARASLLDHDAIHFLLLLVDSPTPTTDVDALSRWLGEFEQRRIGKIVIQNDVGLLETG